MELGHPKKTKEILGLSLIEMNDDMTSHESADIEYRINPLPLLNPQ